MQNYLTSTLPLNFKEILLKRRLIRNNFYIDTTLEVN